MSDTGLAILKGRNRLHCPSFGGRLNAFWPGQTRPKDRAPAFSLLAPFQLGNNRFLLPQALDMQVGPITVAFS